MGSIRDSSHELRSWCVTDKSLWWSNKHDQLAAVSQERGGGFPQRLCWEVRLEAGRRLGGFWRRRGEGLEQRSGGRAGNGYEYENMRRIKALNLQLSYRIYCSISDSN